MKKQSFVAIKLREGDTLLNVEIDDSKKETIFFVTKQGNGLNATKTDRPLTGRMTNGVKGISLNEDDELICAYQVSPKDDIVMVTKKAYIRKINSKFLEPLARARKGSKVIKITEDNGEIIYADIVDHKKEVFIMSEKGNCGIENTVFPLENALTKGKVIKELKGVKIKQVLRYEWETKNK